MEESPKETTKWLMEVTAEVRLRCGAWGWESPLCYRSFFLFGNVFLKNRIISVKVSAGWRTEVPPEQNLESNLWSVACGWTTSLASCPDFAISFPRCSCLMRPQPLGPSGALQRGRVLQARPVDLCSRAKVLSGWWEPGKACPLFLLSPEASSQSS